MSELRVSQTTISGLYQIDLIVHGDARGSFREAFQQEKLEALGLPHLGPVQWNISVNNTKGALRGIHAEPWDKYIHCIHGKAFAAIVDLRQESPTFGTLETFELDETKALFVAQGLGNSYQALTDTTIYGYLVNAHWQPNIPYRAVHYADPEIAIPWPLPVGPNDISEKDSKNPTFASLRG